MDKSKIKSIRSCRKGIYARNPVSYIKVGMQKVNLTPTVNIVNGEK